MAYTDLITFEELRSGALASVDNITNLSAEAEALIASVTREIEDYLDRRLIVRKHTLLYEEIDYEFDAAVSTAAVSNYSFYTEEWPVVEVESSVPAGFTFNVHPDGRRLYTDFEGDSQPIRRIDYFAGYRRADQDLSGLQDEDGLSGLATLPPLLPATIQQVAVRLVVHYLNEMRHDVIGRRTVRASGPLDLTVEGPDPRFRERELRRLDAYRRLT